MCVYVSVYVCLCVVCVCVCMHSCLCVYALCLYVHMDTHLLNKYCIAQFLTEENIHGFASDASKFSLSIISSSNTGCLGCCPSIFSLSKFSMKYISIFPPSKKCINGIGNGMGIVH